MTTTKLTRFVFCLLILFLPTQLAYHFWPDYAFIFGIRIDYLAPAIYLTDILILFLLGLTYTKIKTSYLLAISLFALVNIYFSVSPWVSFWKWLKIIELVFFAKFVYDNKTLFKEKVFVKILSASLITVSLIGIAQFLLGKTIGWPLTFLGERTFSLSTPGIALQDISGIQYLRAYSIFPHPNSFAGFIVVSVLLLFQNKYFNKSKTFWPTLLISLVALILTFSLSAFVGVGLIVILGFLAKIRNFGTMMLLGFDLGAKEIKERLELVKISGEVISKNFLTGSGANTFVFFNRMMQPVHNIFLLVLSETGIIGLGAILVVLYKIFKAFPLIAVFITTTGLFDHYWLTLQQNMLLFALVAGLSLNRKR